VDRSSHDRALRPGSIGGMMAVSAVFAVPFTRVHPGGWNRGPGFSSARQASRSESIMALKPLDSR
jgi:hypothetical protein